MLALLRFFSGLLLAVATCACDNSSPAPGSTESAADEPDIAIVGHPTFARDVAPIIFENCASCHHPGGSGPFSLLTYRDVSRRARQIVDVTSSGYMPPWLPDDGEFPLIGRRRLTPTEIATLAAWVSEGSPEDAVAAMPPGPLPIEGWQLGEPDLVVTLDQPYLLSAEGFDVFRNFVFRVPTSIARYVRAVEFDPGNPKIVHHAVLGLDETLASRHRDATDSEPGFFGMDLGDARPPEGHLLGWTPGNAPFGGYDSIAWKLAPGAELVLQLHMRPSGRPESIQPRIALYFADEPPTRELCGVVLYATEIDIPAGATGYTVENRFTLPTAVDLLGVYPHAHYLGKRIEALAQTPDGRELVLLRIRDWDFNWQDQYRFERPIELAAGTTLTMRYTYDNSAENPRNPSNPPRRVLLGNDSTDEMATLAFELVPKDPERIPLIRESLARQRLDESPRNHHAWTNLGSALRRQGRLDEAVEAFRRATAIKPDHVDAHYGEGVALQVGERFQDALLAYRRTLEIQPDHADALYNVGLIQQTRGRHDLALQIYARALSLAPNNPELLNNIANAHAALNQPVQAAEFYRKALRLTPGDARIRMNLGTALAASGELPEAVGAYREALALDPSLQGARINLEALERRLAEGGD